MVSQAAKSGADNVQADIFLDKEKKKMKMKYKKNMKMFERNDLIFRAIGIFLIYQEELFIKTNWSDPVVPHSLGQTVKEGVV